MKNLNLLINRTEGSVREAQSFVQVNLREGSTRPRQDLEKTSLKGRALSRMSSFMARSWQVAALIMLLLTLGVGQMWAYTIIRNGCLVGEADGTWSNSDAMTQVGSSNVYYITYDSPTAATDLKFRIGTGSEWGTEKNAEGIDNLNSNIVMVSNGDGDSNIKFQVPASVPVTIYYNNSTKKIWIKVESYKTDVLDGKAMFYYGFTKNWSENFAHFYDAGTRKFGSYAETSYADGSAKLAIGVYNVNGSTSYSASNADDWAGVTHTGMAGGDQIQTYNDGSNKCYHNAADQFSFGTTAYSIVVGQTIASFPTISFTSKQSGADADLSLEGYYYATATSGQTWNTFTPGTTESSLAAGTYYIKALATDGAIYMASSNYITLTVNSAPVLGVANATSVSNSSATFNATVTLNSNTTSSYGFKYGAGSSFDTKAELVSGGTSASTSGALAGTSFSKEVTGLSASTTYYYISYAVVNGTTYYSSDVKSFTTSAAPTYSLTVAAGTGISAVTGSTDDISANQEIAITATVATGYTWNTWTKTGAGTLSTYTAGTKNQTVKVGTVGNITLTASATENMSSLSTSCSYDAGDPSYSAPTVSGSHTNVGYATTRSITAATPTTNYTFVGWTITNGARTDGGDDDATTITVRSNGDGSAVSVQANYEEIRDSRWHLVGEDVTSKVTFPDGWSVNSTSMMLKASGYADDDVVYGEVTVDDADGTYEFKVVDDNGASDDIWYGYSSDDNGNQWLIWTETDTKTVYTGSDNDHNLKFTPTVAGTYTFKVDYSGANPEVTITYPVSYQVNFGARPVAAADAPTNSLSISSGGLVLSGSSITFTKDATPNDGYQWKGWYSNETGTGDALGTGNTYATTVSAETNVYACYTEKDYTVTVAAGEGGSVASTSVTGHVATKVTLPTATPLFGYHFTGWEVTSGTATITSASSANAAQVNGMTDAVTVTANFARTYAYIEGRFHIWNAARSGDWTNTFDEGNWDVESQNIELSYNSDDHYYYLHTYATPKELTSEIGGTGIDYYPWFFIKTSTSSSSLENTAVNRPHASGDVNQLLTTAGDSNKKSADGTGDNSFRFNSSDESGYVVLGFKKFGITYDPYIYYWLEQSLEYNGNGSDGGSAPASKTYYDNGASATVLDNTFTRAGYTFVKWNTAVNGSGADKVKDNTLTMDANYTLYAQWKEDEYDVDVAAGDHGSVSTDKVESIGISTASGDITATADEGYYFTGWTLPAGVTAADGFDQYDNPIQINATASDKEITANFAPKWAVAGTMTDPTWATDVNLIENITSAGTPTKYTGYKEIALDANSTYSFKIMDRPLLDDGWYGMPKGEEDDLYYSNSGSAYTLDQETGNQNIQLHTAGKGTYRLTWNMTDKKLTITYPTSRFITMGTKTYFVAGDPSASGEEASDISTTGGDVTAEDSDGNTITNQKFVKNNGSITFTADPEVGYTFAGWYSNSDYAEGNKYVDNASTIVINDAAKTLTLSSITADKAVYAKFVENAATVTLSATNGKIQYWDGDSWEDASATVNVGVLTTCSIKAVPNTGYYFAGWKKTACTDYAITVSEDSESANNTTLSGLGTGAPSGEVLTAQFVELDKIYFRNIFDDGENEPTRWSNVYVFYDITWNGYGQAQTKNDDTYRAAMTQIGQTDIYWAYVPRAFTVKSGERKNVGFSDTYFAKNYTFYHIDASGAKAATRGDYNHALDLFVPHHEVKTENNYGVDYYDNGFWMKHETRALQGAGYYLKRYTSRGNYDDKGEFAAVADNSTTIQVTVRVDNIGDDYNKFMLTASGGLNYLADEEINSLSGAVGVSDNTQEISTNDVYFQLKPTAEGDYTFILDQSGDKMTLRVDYPVSPGDYRLKHTYTRSETTYTTYSDVIKASAASSGVTASMYLSTEGTETLVLQECDHIDGTTKQPVWTDGDATNLSAITTAVGINYGVYQFDITVNTTTHKANTVTNIKKYEGDFYIKTDCAPGNWTDYKRNVMAKNTINASDFDNYFCTNVSSGRNVKFVISNDYNIAVSDTIVQDATYLTTAGGGSSYEYMPESSCIRFSYNSATNEAKRAYLRYSNNTNFLNIIPSASGKVYDAASAGNDLYGASGAASANNKFGEDDGNYVYRKIVYAVSGATIDVKAEYTGNTKKQTFVTGKTLISSSDEDERYPVRVVYDFKTNHLTTAWEATEGLTDELTGIELIYVRDGQAAANQVTFGSGGTLTESKVCAVFQFDYDDYVGKVGAWPNQLGQETGYTNKMCMFYFSFPFDVNVSDIFGIGTYGKEWKIQYYDGAERAKKGFFRGDGTTTFWKDVPADSVLTANVGYSLMLDNDYFNTTSSGMVFEGKTSGKSVYLYFPSASAISIASGSRSITVPEHKCTINRTFYDETLKKTVNHRYTDTDWNMMGVPLFSNQAATDYSGTFNQQGDTCNYLYSWSYSDNKLSVSDASSFAFNAMHAYMVQYHGSVSFTGSVIPTSVAARTAPMQGNYKAELQVLNSNEEMINHTYVELKENACDTFALNEDLYMSPNGRAAEIFSFAGEYDVAANVLSIANHTVELGLTIRKAGTYTISMPSNFSGTVTLVDTYNQTRTDLMLGDYDVYLEPGTYVNRFYLNIDIKNVTTSLENTGGTNTLKDGGCHKFIRDDEMFILKNGVVYDAQGRMVE